MTDDRSGMLCAFYYLIKKQEGYSNDEAIGLAFERHPRAMKHYRCPTNTSPAISGSTASTKSRASAEPTSSFTGMKPYVRTAAELLRLSGAANADPE